MADHVKNQMVGPQKVSSKKRAMHACNRQGGRRAMSAQKKLVVGVDRSPILHSIGSSQMGNGSGRSLDDRDHHTGVH